MPTYNDYGIVLSSSRVFEADKILNIYTKGNGLVRALARGTRKLSSKFSGKLEQLSCSYFHFAKGRNMDTICDLKQVTSFPLLRSDLTLLSYGILFLEVVKSFAHEGETESKEIYDLLYKGLDELQNKTDPDLFALRFILEFLSIHGLRPQFKTCVSCNSAVRNQRSDIRFFYSSVLGGLLCKECSETIDNKLLSPEVLEVLEKAEEQNINFSDKNINQALDLLREHTDQRAKHKIKSFDLVFSL